MLSDVYFTNSALKSADGNTHALGGVIKLGDRKELHIFSLTSILKMTSKTKYKKVPTMYQCI